MNDDDKKEILAALTKFQEENSNQNVTILSQLQTLQDHHLEGQARMNKFEQDLQELKSKPPAAELTPSVRTALSQIPRDRLPTLTGEERREQALTVTKSINVVSEASTQIANANDTIAKTVRLLPYVTVIGMLVSAFLAGVVQYFASTGRIPIYMSNQPPGISAPATSNTVPAPAR
jgi:hypothetical protein